MRSWSFSRQSPLPDRATFDHPFASLLWPEGQYPPEEAAAQWVRDLGIDDLALTLTQSPRHRAFARRILTTLSSDPAVVTWRQAVLADLLANPELVDKIEALLPYLANMQDNQTLFGAKKRGILLSTSERLANLEIYADTILKLHDILSEPQFKAPALVQLRHTVEKIIKDTNFQYLQDELPELRRPLQRITSLTIGINLDLELRPKSAVLISINDYEIGEPMSFLERVIGPRSGSEVTGIAPVHHVPGEASLRPLTPLFQDMERLMTEVAEPVERALRQYTRVSVMPLIHLEYELAFYVNAIRLMETMRARDIPLCQPEVAPLEERAADIRGMVSLNLALRESIVPVANDVKFDENGRIAVLTGPNSGGKTTYLRGVGLAQVMFQAGLFVPARQARMSPVDAIFTHFPALETRQQGRLAEEAERLREIFAQISRYSLVLLNETFAATASREAVYLAQDMLTGFRVIGLRTIYATHLTELVDRISDIEAAQPGDSRLYSLVAGIEFDEDLNGQPTYDIRRGEPLDRSYAREIARRFGIDLPQILAAHQDRTTRDDHTSEK
ncbi:MAG: MutS-related protein [Chloroflexota bacterium]